MTLYASLRFPDNILQMVQITFLELRRIRRHKATFNAHVKSNTLCITFIRLSLEAKPEEHSEDDRMKPVLEALAELKEDISPEEAIAAVK